LQTGNPALGTGFQRSNVLRREVESHDLVEESGGFSGREAQVGRAQLGHLPPAAQAGQGELRILAGCDDQAHLRRLVFEQKGQSPVNRSRCVDSGRRAKRFGISQVVIVKDKDEFLAGGRDLVQQHGQERFDRRRLGGLERSLHP